LFVFLGPGLSFEIHRMVTSTRIHCRYSCEQQRYGSTDTGSATAVAGRATSTRIPRLDDDGDSGGGGGGGGGGGAFGGDLGISCSPLRLSLFGCTHGGGGGADEAEGDPFRATSEEIPKLPPVAYAVGGGGAKSRLWMEILASVTAGPMKPQR
jgi:hypothetical protein